MAYGLKYEITYRRRSNNNTTIEIHQRDYAGSSTELIADGDCLKFTGGKDHLFTPTIGIGAQINVLVNSLDLRDLYTTDEQEFEVYVYNNSETAPIYKGYITTEIFAQDYTTNINVPMTIQCNDGMAVLDTIYYTPTADLTTIGLTQASEVIQNILTKISHTYTNIYTNATLLLTGQTSTSDHILYFLQVDERNYVDESNKWMTCRQVLDAIIQPFGMNMYFRGDHIYLIDCLNLHTSQGKYYAVSDFGYLGTTSIGGASDLSGTTMNYYLTGQNIDIEPQKKEASIKYSPYNREEISYNFADPLNMATEGDFGLYHSGPLGVHSCYYNSGVTFTDWTINNATYGYQRGTYPNDDSSTEDDGDYYLSIYKTPLYDGDITVMTYEDNTSIITGSNKLVLQLTFDAMVNIRDEVDIYSGDIDNPNLVIKEFSFGVAVKIGNYYYDSNTSLWTLTPSFVPIYVRNIDDNNVYQNISNVWTSCKSVRINFNNAVPPNGFLSVEITDYFNIVYPYGNEGPVTSILLKNFNVNFYRIVGKNIVDVADEDVKTTGTLDLTATNNFSTINTIHGTNDVGISKGNFRYSTTNAIVLSGYTYGSNYYPIEKILIQNIISQYRYPRFKLNANLTTDVQLTTIDLLYNKLLVSDNRYFPNMSFLLMNGTYHDVEENIEAQLLELTKIKEPNE